MYPDERVARRQRPVNRCVSLIMAMRRVEAYLINTFRTRVLVHTHRALYINRQ